MDIKRTLLIILSVILFFGRESLSQSETEYFPEILNISPLRANFLEARTGFVFKISENDLRLDVGNSRDILHITSDSWKFSFGADFFTYTKLRGEENFHFPVDAVDYLFGVNFGIKKLMRGEEFGARLRISHISAHFVDGHYEGSFGRWRDGRNPTVYSREFFELIPYYTISHIKVYTGLTYLIHVVPEEIGKYIVHSGFEYKFDNIFSDEITPILAYDFKLGKLNKYTGTNSISAGIKFGDSDGIGLSVMFNYFSGYSIHGEYFDIYEQYSGINFNLDF